ncbi:MAG: hypothetical protein U0361_02890 [Nitrospiraceae bacterium]
MMRPGDGVLPRIGDGDDGYALSPYLKFVATPKEAESGLTSFHLSGYSIWSEAVIGNDCCSITGHWGWRRVLRTDMPMHWR